MAPSSLARPVQPGEGLEGPQDLRGRSRAGPRRAGARPYRLRMGRLRAGPFGAIGPGGKSVVFWRGKAGHLWFAEQASGSSWIGPRNLGGHVA